MKLLSALGAIALFAVLTLMLLIGGRPARAVRRMFSDFDAFANAMEREL